MKYKKLTAWILAIVMAFAVAPAVTLAGETNGNQLQAVDGDILVVYQSDAACTEALQQEGFQALEEQVPESVEQLAQECGDSVAEQTGANVESSAFIADSLGDDGAVLQVTLDKEEDVDQAIEKLQEDPDVAYAQKNYVYELFENETPAGDQSGDQSDTQEGDQSSDQSGDQSGDQQNSQQGDQGGNQEGDQSGTQESDQSSDQSGDPQDGDQQGGSEEGGQSIFQQGGSQDAASLDSGTNDPRLSEQYYLNPWTATYRGANLYNAWNLAKTEHTVSVAVLDTGVKIDHPDLVDNLDLKHAEYIIGNTVRDILGHGTHVAGIIGAVANNETGVAGVSYNAKIIPIKVFNDKSKTNSGYLVKAYKYLAGLVQSGEVKDLHVINMSFGGYAKDDDDVLLEAAIHQMRRDYDVITVCAGGNGRGGDPRTDTVYPGDFEDCLCVTALDKAGNNVKWSDYNKYKDISAPGIDIMSTYCEAVYEDVFDENTQKWETVPVYVKDEEGNYVLDEGGNKIHLTEATYESLDGTSMSAPLVSGIMALLWAEKPNLTVSEAVEAVESTAKPVNKAKCYTDRKDHMGSKGAIDAAAALEYVKRENILAFLSKTKLKTTKYTYSGKAKKPGAVVGNLVAGKDFKIVYQNNVKVGKATANITGIGAYRGTITKTFTIYPKGTNIKSLKRYRKAFKVKWAKQSKQTSGYQIQYSRKSSMKNAKTKKVSGAAKTYLKIKGLKAKKKYYVRVRTYKKVNGKIYYSKWSKKKAVKTK